MRLVLGFLLLGSGLLTCADWPRFRGGNGNGVADTGSLPPKFNPRENLIWRIDLPPGHSSPVLSEAHIYLTAFEGDKLLTICLNRSSGKVLWKREAPRARNDKVDKRNSPASPSPVTDGQIGRAHV